MLSKKRWMLNRSLDVVLALVRRWTKLDREYLRYCLSRTCTNMYGNLMKYILSALVHPLSLSLLICILSLNLYLLSQTYALSLFLSLIFQSFPSFTFLLSPKLFHITFTNKNIFNFQNKKPPIQQKSLRLQ